MNFFLKWDTMTNTLLARMCAIALSLTVFGLYVEAGDIAGKADLRNALATAKTPADHARIADYYEQLKLSYVRKQTEEEDIAARWKKQYENWTKIPNPYHSAVNLAGYYRQMAKDAAAHAREQNKLATAEATPAR